MIGRRGVLGAALAGLPGCAGAAGTSVALRSVEGFPVVAARIAGAPVSFVLDTGAEGHLVRPSAKVALGLPALPGSVPIQGTGGAGAAPLVTLAQVELGGVALDPAPAPVIELPLVPAVVPEVAGLLGEPVLDQFDLLLDAAQGQLGLQPAGAAAAPFSTRVTLTVTRDRQVLAPVVVNGVPMTALVDTGSRATLLTVAAAGRLGLAQPGSANVARGVDGQALPVGHVRVASLAVGADRRENVPVSVAPLAAGSADLLLGWDYLGSRRVWLSAATRVMAIDAARPPRGG